ncbi:SDR family NAD(P)-dependent oxidoreductase [Acinetobacter haemolyticus]|uniref:UDP-glucose 4-epimerase n=1 Tax=Acinetobacter haemolyticus TaxID=29430 RepID=A0A857IJZ2_ACIHA|nr:SDR family NAD(P)-dependent oxidoreductase [Acinetobacter haemolyticus]ENW20001.1 UDP-glucose 4-epimerase [Acinetobacter haemolyticus NIPH 261]QHI10236.1 SDR family NAD(P)-dependent oxidoreductase [Acinetobacter haemolyticus]QHI13500.1 SDR family NAD(P)-dependent oxidoreductase [Acinetobacter haemolyticus]
MILVTGGLGFIGSHIALSLLAHGKEIVIVDNLANSTLQTLERLEYISGMYIPFAKLDVRNTPALNKVFEQYSIDTVIHTASFKSLEESTLKPLEYYNDNVSCIMSLLRAMQRMGVRQLVNLSSIAVYGQSDALLSEETAFNYSYPNPYIRSQQIVEDIIADTYKVDHEWKIVNLRLSNIVGAFEHGVLGEYVVQLPKNIVPLALQVAAMQRECIDLQNQAETDDGTVERSFLHVLDVCEAVMMTMNWLETQNSCLEAFNLAHKQLTSIQTLLDEIAKVTQAEIRIQPAVYQHQELARLGANIEKAKQVLNWEPKRSLTQMLEDEWRFYLNTLKGN